MKKFLLFLYTLLFVGFTFAHQPRLVFMQPGQVVQVKNPEISQAFYGNLSGQEDVYQIVADTGFLLYVNLVVPDISGSRTDFTVHIIEGDDAIFVGLDGTKFQWTTFFEKFAGDTYLQWPSREKQVTPGTYTIKVSNPGNQGKYSLAIGKIESFPVNEIIKTFKAMPALKMTFFQKPRYTIFSNYVGWFFGILLVIAIGLVWWGVKLVNYWRRK